MIFPEIKECEKRKKWYVERPLIFVDKKKFYLLRLCLYLCTHNDVGTLGLCYQYGRWDMFVL